MTSLLLRRVTLPAAFVAIFVSCIDTSTSSSSSSSSSGGGVAVDGGDGGDDAAPSLTGYEDLCAAYAQATANCCAQGAETCRTSKVEDWNSYCLGYARRCAGMPTCFSGSDCNTLVYCASSC
jgi:hypothetical protein